MLRLTSVILSISASALLLACLQIPTAIAADLGLGTIADPACESEMSFGGDSAHTHEDGCEGGGETNKPPSSFYKDKTKSKQVSYGPKLKYRVEYFRQCEPALMQALGCDANPDPPCTDGSYPLLRFIYAVNGPRKGQLVGTDSYCSREPNIEIPGAELDIAKVTPERFRELPILASTIISQPKSFSLRNGHAHMYAESKTQSFAVAIFDQNVRIRAIPISYGWSYGDGISRRLSFPGVAVAQRGFDEPTTTSHVYRETGDFGVGLSTRFRGEYSTEGGPWTPIPGVANVPSAPLTMSVWRTKKILVAENCNDGSTAPGCGSLFDD
ncbi:hypothetical protein J2S64_003802 [Paeniglutamicibacter sulfureus]|uniref:PKD domain-containing protein n=1 Tax=Paeniglutamicibacter sulfureus TaxID=43666 RepID=A0ABU2BP93_9MICC|nr:hypothetical protein [Paeniglutamicibacter sulfureus]